jgi:hypothetical protein
MMTFWAKANAAKNLSIEIVQSFGSGGSPSASVNTFVQKIAIGTAWAKYTVPITVPSISGKTIGTDGAHTSSLAVVLWMSAGSALATRTDTLGIQTGTFDFAQMQFEEGKLATKFEERPVGLELAMCQRYFEVAEGGAIMTAFGASQIRSTICQFKATKRISAWSPTISGNIDYWNGTANVAVVSPSVTRTIDSWMVLSDAMSGLALYAAYIPVSPGRYKILADAEF